MKKLVLLASLLVFISTSFCQIDKIFKEITGSKDVKIDPPISTSIKDAYPPAFFLRNLDKEIQADSGKKYSPNQLGGYYRYKFKTFCLKAGTFTSGKDDGYLLAPLKGKKAQLIQNILNRYIVHQEINQNDVQELIWGIESGMKFSKYPKDFQLRVKPLLSDEEIASMDVDIFDIAKDLLPNNVKEILKLYTDINDKLSLSNSSYEDVERLAVKEGTPSTGKGSINIERGTWTMMGNGVYLRCLPRGYRNALVEEYIPTDIIVARDEKNRIVSMDDGINKIEITYDDSEGSDSFNGEPIWRFKTITVSGSVSFTKNDIGWYIPSGTKVSGNSSYKRYEDASEPEYKARQKVVNDYIQLIKKTLGKKKQNLLNEKDLNTLKDLKNFELALRFIIGMNEQSDKWYEYDYPLAVNALYKFSSDVIQEKIRGGSEKLNGSLGSITGIVFVPCNTSLQRLGTIGDGGIVDNPPDSKNDGDVESYKNKESDNKCKPKVILKQIDKNYLPAPETNLAAEIEVKINDGENCKIQGVRYKLFDISRELGRCLNDKERGYYDTRLDFNIDFQMNPSLKISQDSLTAQSDSYVNVINILCNDWGAFGKLAANVLIDGEWIPAEAEGTGLSYINLPYDANGNKIADKWEDDNLVTGFPSDYDEDNIPFGQATKGDGITNYEEYRGFWVEDALNGKEHIRTNPNKKDIFVIDFFNLFSPLSWESASGIDAHLITKDMVLGELAGYFDQQKYRWVDFCSGFANGEKYALNIIKIYGTVDPFGNYPSLGDSTGRYIFAYNKFQTVLGPPKNSSYIAVFPDVVRKWLYSESQKISNLIAGSGGVAGIFIDTQFISIHSLQNFVDAVNNESKLATLIDFLLCRFVLHEVGHGCGLDHHGSGNPALLGTGDKNCPMIYPNQFDEVASSRLLLQLMDQIDSIGGFLFSTCSNLKFCNTGDNCWGKINVNDR